MKKALLAIGGVAILIGVAYLVPTKVTVTAPDIQVVEKEKVVEVNPLDEQIKNREKELEEKYSKIKSIEARVDVLKAERERLDTEIKSLQKELSNFMTATASKN